MLKTPEVPTARFKSQSARHTIIDIVREFRIIHRSNECYCCCVPGGEWRNTIKNGVDFLVFDPGRRVYLPERRLTSKTDR